MTGWDIAKIKKRKIIEYFSHSRGQNVLVYPERSRRVKILATIIALIGAILIVSGVIFYLFSTNFFAEGMMQDGDEAAHMFLPKYAVDYFKTNHRFPVINPYWYNGIEAFHHTPWLGYIPIAAIYLITKDIYFTNRLITFLLLCAAGMSIFFLLYKKNNLRSAIIGGILFPFTPTIFYLALTSVTRVLPFILLPLVFYFTDKVLEKKYRFQNFLILCLIITAMLFSHPLDTLSSLIFPVFYILMRIIIDRKVHFNKFFIWLSAFLIACGLIAWFAIPFLLEPTNYNYSYEITIEGIRTRALPLLFMFSNIPIFIVGLLSFLRQRNQKNWALFCSVIFAFLFYTPISYSFYKLFPWFYASAALVWIIIVMLYWATTFFEFSKLKPRIRISIALIAIPVLIIGGLIAFNKNQQTPDVYPINKIRITDYEKTFSKLITVLKEKQNPGRVFLIKNVSGLDWIIPAVAQKYYSEGHYFSITRLNKEIAWINDTFNEGYYNYIISRMDLFNDRYFVVTRGLEEFLKNNPPQGSSFYELLEENDFRRIFWHPEEKATGLYYQDKPSSYLIPLEEKTLLIGKYAYNYAAFQPNSYIGGSIYLDDYDLEFLKNFDNLVLYSFGYRDKAKVEKLVSDYAKQGGRVTIDMLNIQNSKLEVENIFLGVQSVSRRTNSSLKLDFASNLNNKPLPNTLEIPSTKDFGRADLSTAKIVPLKEWRFTEYLNLDGSLARWQNREDEDNDLYSLIGYKNIDGNKVWFLGGNLIYHAYLTHSQSEQEFIRRLTLGNSGQTIKRQETIEINSQNLDPEAGRMEFSYTAESSGPLLVSYTISPHWKAYLDGQPIKIYNIDAMMAINLPAGSHNVTLKYENLPYHYLADGITLLTLVMLIYIFYLSRKRGKESV